MLASRAKEVVMASARPRAFMLAIALLPIISPARAAQGQTYRILHSFDGMVDGISPFAGLFLSSTGNLYGTTESEGAFGDGTVFRLNTDGSFTVLHSFSDAEGAGSDGVLIRDSAGAFYGTARLDGIGESACGGLACGTVFKLYQRTLTVLHTFTGPDGAEPSAGLTRDSVGNLYGTTRSGGAFNDGTVFKLDTAGTLTVLHSFSGGKKDGRWPYDGLVHDGAGNLYGTTDQGGTPGRGTVFKLNERTGKYRVLYSFPGAPGGANPMGGLIRDSAGNLYGTTAHDGAFGGGTVFKLNAPTLTILHSFTKLEGESPFAGLVRDSAGNLYGTTNGGGSYGVGTVFEISP